MTESQIFDINPKIIQYEQFLNEVLRNDLKKVLDERDVTYQKIADYLQLKTAVEQIKESDLNGGPLKTKVDLGCNFYVQAKVPDTSMICVCVGFGFYVEMTMDEALDFIDKKTSFLKMSVDQLTKDAAKVKAHIKLVLEGLRELQNISSHDPRPPQRDIFL
ncbi:protein UXT homolog [Lineus longissimus]|uniref:protein UXT homolog n=1 Tax=Lineus longissimus TaxID=88925 RepID=UPI00315D5BE8